MEVCKIFHVAFTSGTASKLISILRTPGSLAGKKPVYICLTTELGNRWALGWLTGRVVGGE